jgi:ADP-ribose pyrophosphatase YjhB (NUDIX family)
MTQMYKVFVNDLPLIIAQNVPDQIEENAVIIHAPNLADVRQSVKWLFNQKVSEVWLCGDVRDIWKKCFSIARYIPAAGGMVFNENNELLMIHRLGRWDLPKGKCEEGETVAESAMREVREECGIEELFITRELPSTYHYYLLKEKLILKRTYWYEMKSDDTHLTPQTEEDISQVDWVSANEMDKKIAQSYAAIKWLMTKRKG